MCLNSAECSCVYEQFCGKLCLISWTALSWHVEIMLWEPCSTVSAVSSMGSLPFPPWNLCSFAACIRLIREKSCLWDLCLYFRAFVYMWGWVRRIFFLLSDLQLQSSFQGGCGRYWCFELFWSKSDLSWMVQWRFIGGFPCPSKYVVFIKKLKTFNLEMLSEQKGASLGPQWGICLPLVSCLSKCPCPNCMYCGKLSHGAL